MPRYLKFLIAAILGAASSFSFAAPVTIDVSQKDKMFMKDGKEIKELELNIGDSINFKNDDPTPHNVFSTSELDKFDLKIQKPQSENVHKFEKEGEITVRCAIHNKMVLKVKVKK